MKTNLKDTTFLFLIKVDTIERMENLLLVTNYILENFETNIKVMEVNEYSNDILKKLLCNEINYSYIQDDDPILHRTRYLNMMTKDVKTPFVAIWDTDVIIQRKQIKIAMNLLRNNSAQIVYPYKDHFLDTSFILRKLYIKTKDFSFLSNNIDKMSDLYLPKPVGGAFICNLVAYKEIGLENEDFYGWGVEDGDRYIRWKNSKYTIKKVNGVLFHLTHPRSVNSQFHNQTQSYIKLRILYSTLIESYHKYND